MKRFILSSAIKNFIIISIFAVFCSKHLLSQNDNKIIISTKIELINGKDCYIHHVLKGQTLYAIAKAYQVNEDEIIAENPQVKQGLKVDSYLRIPVKKNKDNPINNTSILYHTVQKKETLYGIAHKYNVSEASILSLNPDAKNGLKEGMFLKIETEQKNNLEKVSPNKHDEKQTIFYTVLKGETLYGISKRFNTSTTEIKIWNPDINESLKEGMQLKLILTNEQIPKDFLYNKPIENKKDSIKPIKKPSLCDCDKPNLLNEYNIALMLPFYTELTYKISTNGDKADGNYKSFSNIQFYEGFLLAVDSVKKTGVNINLHVYDVNEDTIAFKDLLQGSELSKMNLIFAPFNNNCIEILRKFNENRNIRIVTSQITNANNFNKFPNFINIAPSVVNQLFYISNYFSSTYADANFVVVHNDRENEKEFIDSLKLFLKNGLRNAKNFNDVNEVIYSTEGIAGLTKKLSDSKNNIIITMINNDIFVADYVRKLSEILDKYQLIVVGMPSWKNFEHIEIEYFQKIKLHLFSNNFIDYSDTLVKNFVKEFRLKYKVEPDQYAFQGFDAGKYFMTALASYGLDFDKCLSRIDVKQLENKFEFQKNRFGCFENKHLTIFTFKDYQMTDVEKISTDSIVVPNK